MIQVVSGSSSGSITGPGMSRTTLLGGVLHTLTGSNTNVGDVVPIDCTIRNIFLVISVAPGALGSGASRRFTVCVNDIPTSVVIEIAEDQTYGEFLPDLDLLEGQWVTLECENFGAASAGFSRWGYEIETAGATQAVFFGRGGPLNSVTLRYGGVLAQQGDALRVIGGGPEACTNVVPIDGTITGYRVRVKENSYLGTQYLTTTATIYKSTDGGDTWVKQDGSGGTIDTRLSLVHVLTTTQGVASFELPVARGDLLYTEWETTDADGAQWGYAVGLLFTSSEENQWPYCGQPPSIGGTGGPVYHAIFSSNAIGWSGSDAGRQRSQGGVTDFSLARPIFYLPTVPGPGDTREFLTNLNGVDQDLVVSFAEGDRFAEDLIHAVPITEGDEFGITATNSGSPGSNVSWGYVQGVEEAEEGGGGETVLLPRGVIGPLIVHHIPYDDGAT